MNSLIEKLTRILSLEAEGGYQDRAVIGGLARFADAWLQEASEAFGPESQDWVQAVATSLRSYSSQVPLEERKGALDALVELLQRGRGGEVEEQAPEPGSVAVSPVVPVPPAPPPAVTDEPVGLAAPVTALRGVGERQAQRLARLGLNTVRDVLMLLPHRYDDFSKLKTINRLEYGEEVTIIARVVNAESRKTRKGGDLFRATMSDGTGQVDATWFNQPYLAGRVKGGDQIVVSGKVDQYMGRLCFTSPEWEPARQELLHTGRLVAVYPLTAGVGARWLRNLIKRTVDYWAPRLPDHLPASIREAHNLIGLETALRQVHFPDNGESLEKARRRLSFDEMFVFQLGLLLQRNLWRSKPGRSLPIDDATLQAFVLALPFALTGAQQRALAHIVQDIRSEHPMNRLLQGDVGSGKTVVAAAAMALVVSAGAQAALMAPTEILAEQHYETLTQLFSTMAQRPAVRLLTGSVTGAERDEIYAGLADGSIDIVVGTHALIQEGVSFRDLAFAVVDEQHRFGVRQRAALREKGRVVDGQAANPHMLVMTATPIPRSLQLTVWGHLDVSLIDELPPGRQPVQTRVIVPRERERGYAFLRSQIEKGRQAFIICPLVEESPKIMAKAAVDEYTRLKDQVFGDLCLGLLHGRMKSDEKDAAMTAFSRGETDILVATSVVEVGIDVPNATVMFIEGAERFGLSQLHQFRGRVGRGEHASYCLLVSESNSQEALERLEAVAATNDGFVLAQKDLDIRGPGEFLGTRQSGMPDLKMASLTDLRLLESAREAARGFLETDPELRFPQHQLLMRRVADLWVGENGEVS